MPRYRFQTNARPPLVIIVDDDNVADARKAAEAQAPRADVYYIGKDVSTTPGSKIAICRHPDEQIDK